MNEYGYRVEIPYCAQAIKHCEKEPFCKQCVKEFHSSSKPDEKRKNKKQLTTIQANNTRSVTKVILIIFQNIILQFKTITKTINDLNYYYF
jgi:hypothetical protein